MFKYKLLHLPRAKTLLIGNKRQLQQYLKTHDLFIYEDTYYMYEKREDTYTGSGWKLVPTIELEITEMEPEEYKYLNKELKNYMKEQEYA